MKQKIFQTDDSWTPLILRIFLGLVVFPHGAQKLFGWFGGYGFSGTMSFFTGTVGLPWAVGLLVILLESVGAVALMAGIATRLIVINYILLAIGIVFSSHIENGFFMNWFGNQAGEGYEYFLLWIGLSIGLTISGSGKFSVDKDIIMKNKPVLVGSKV
jgi:putative oxidoreductase